MKWVGAGGQVAWFGMVWDGVWRFGVMAYWEGYAWYFMEVRYRSASLDRVE